jgi:multidrug transporter EmrE-like cation transporter
MNPLPFAALAASAVVQASGSALMKYATSFKAGPFQSQPKFLAFTAAAMVLFGCGFPLYMVGLSRLKLSVAQPVFSASMFVVTTIIAMTFFRESIRAGQVVGLALILGGIASITMAA